MIDKDDAKRLVNEYAHRWPPGSFLAELEYRDVVGLLSCGEERRYGAGKTLIRKGEDDQSVFLLLHAVVKVYTDGATRRRGMGGRVLHDIRSSGDLVGEVAFVDRRKRSATVVTAQPDCVFMRLPDDLLTEFVDAEPHIHRKISASAMGKMRALVQRHEDAGCPTDVSLARALVQLVERHGRASDGSWVLDVGMKQEELGTYINIGRTAVARELGTLRDQGILRTHREVITVLDLDRLRERAQPQPI